MLLPCAVAAPRACGQEPQAIQEAMSALDAFFELGLPDTKNAKWVRVESGTFESDLFNPDGRSGDAGNGWLLSEDADGFEVIVNQVKRVRGKKAPGKEDDAPGGLEAMEVKPADLAKDGKAFVARLKAQVAKAAKSSEDDNWELQQMRQQCGPALLFLAQLHRRGEVELVRDALPMVLSLAGSANNAVDGAVATLAEERLKELSEAWIKNGDAAAYADGLDALVAKFTRGWKMAGAARVLAQRLRKPVAASNLSPGSKAVADLLLSIKSEQIGLLPIGQVWVLPLESGGEDGEQPRMRRHRRALSGIGMSEVQGELSPELKRFFSEPRKAVSALVELIGDQRMLRVAKASVEYSSFSNVWTDGEPNVVQQFAAMTRPMELGELAEALVAPLMPERTSYSFNGAEEDLQPIAKQWLATIAPLSDEDLAWVYLRGAQSTSDDRFQTALPFLIKNGGQETRTKLMDVFGDPAVWMRNGEWVLEMAEKFVNTIGVVPDGFAGRIKNAAAEAQAENKRERGSYVTRDPQSQKFEEQRNAAFLKRLEQLSKPVDIGSLIGEVAAANDLDTLRELFASHFPVIGKAQGDEVTSAMLRAAAESKALIGKAGLLMMIGIREDTRASDGKGVVVFDERTRQALKELLADHSSLASLGANQLGGATISEAAAFTVAGLGLPRDQMGAWMEVSAAGERFRKARDRAFATAVAEGTQRPAIPRPGDIPPEELAMWVAELKMLSPLEIHRAISASPLERQIAFSLYLQVEEAAWPDAILKAHLTIVEVGGNGAAKIGADRWKGRVLDDALLREITETVSKGGFDTPMRDLYLQSVGIPLGLQITVNDGTAPRYQRITEIQGIIITPENRPDALLIRQTSSGASGKAGVSMSEALWKDPARDEMWRKVVAGAKTAKEGDARSEGEKDHTRELEAAWKAFLAGAKQLRGVRAYLLWQTSTLAPAKPDETEDDE